MTYQTQLIVARGCLLCIVGCVLYVEPLRDAMLSLPEGRAADHFFPQKINEDQVIVPAQTCRPVPGAHSAWSQPGQRVS